MKTLRIWNSTQSATLKAEKDTLERGLQDTFPPRLNEVIIYQSGHPADKGNTAAHEQEHKIQAERFSGVDINNSYWETLKKSDLAFRQPRPNTDNIHKQHKKGDLLSQLPKLGYESGLLASWIEDRPDTQERLGEIEKEIEETEPGFATKMKSIVDFAKENDIDGFGDPEEVNTEYSTETCESILEAHNYLQEQKGDDQILRWREPRLSAEMEGFAHFLSGVLKQRKWRTISNEFAPPTPEIVDRADYLENETDCYDQLIPGTDQRVADIAAERVRELAGVKENLEEHGGMSEEEAVQYIMNEVQERKFEYAESQLQEYEDVEDVRERLRNDSIA
ncbi:MAG: hypothetical protein ABEJ72_06470 [Candidatus Aenigmatarchaeota archaeon]